MEIIKINSILDYNSIMDNLVATIGEFDGVHLAHKKLFNETLKIAQKKNLKSAVITFEPHPDKVINKDQTYVSLLSLEEKCELISKYHFDYLIIITFDNYLSKMSHKDFVQKFLIGLGVKEVVVGFDFHYGFHGEGISNSIITDSEHKINVNIIPEMIIDNQKIGSSLIKKMLNEGDLQKANTLLGYYYTIKGIVVHGRNIGEKIKVPTANLRLNRSYPHLKEGVYAGKCIIDGQKLFAICNIGHNPSFNYYENLSYEIHIIEENFKSNLYGKEISIELIEYLREEKKFKNIKDFQGQIECDKNRAFLVLNNTL